MQVTLNHSCQAEITPNLLLEPDACEDQYTVVVYDGPNPNFANVLLTSPYVTANEKGKVLAVEVILTATGASCWGPVTVEDKTPPVIECLDDITIGCDSLAWYLAAIPQPVSTLSATAAVLPVNIVDISTVSATTTTLIGPGSVISQILDVNVNVGIDHSWLGELDIEITSPSGTTVTLLTGQCGDEEQILATFDDEAGSAPQCDPGYPSIHGTVTPAAALGRI